MDYTKNNFYKSGRGLAFFANQVHENSVDLRSATVRLVVDVSSRNPRDLSDTCSSGLREVFDCCSATTRTAAEEHSNDYRSCPEQAPKRTRSASEGSPNSTRRNRWFFDRFLDKLKVGIKYRCSIDVVLFMQLLRKIEGKFLTNVFCTSGVPYPYLFNTTTTQAQPKNDLRITQEQGNDKPSLSLPQPSLRTVYRQGSPKGGTRDTQETANNDTRKRVGATKNKRILHLGFFCFMLFNLSDAWAQSAESRTAEGQQVDMLKVRDTSSYFKVDAYGRPIFEYDYIKYPKVNKYTLDTASIYIVRKGETIKSKIWTDKYWCIDPAINRDSLQLSEYQDAELLILDFWSTACAPCIRSMQKLNEISDAYNGRVKVIGVLLDHAYKGMPYTKYRNWSSPSIIGAQALSLTRSFFKRELLGYAVLIKDNKLLGVSAGTALNQQIIDGILAGSVTDIDNITSWAY